MLRSGPRGNFELNIEILEANQANVDRANKWSNLWGLRRSLGLDRAVIFTVLARGWTSLAGLVTVLLIAHFLTGAEQGYYYTFGSLVALQIVFELGFSFVILQMASHECAHLSLASDGTVTGSPMAHGRLASVLQKPFHPSELIQTLRRVLEHGGG